MTHDIERRLDDALAEMHARGLTRLLGFGERPALVAVDFTRAFTDPQMPLAADFSAELEQTARLARAARAGGSPVYFTVTAYDEPDLADAGVWAEKVPATTTLRSGTAGVELDPRGGREPGDGVVLKKYASAFFGTDLATRLTSRRVDTILLAGCTTSGCVRATAVDGLQHGFRVMVVREAVGDRNPDAHLQSLLDMQTKYADIVTVAQVEDYLGALVGA
jgi:maleamate amidohydrolase